MFLLSFSRLITCSSTVAVNIHHWIWHNMFSGLVMKKALLKLLKSLFARAWWAFYFHQDFICFQQKLSKLNYYGLNADVTRKCNQIFKRHFNGYRLFGECLLVESPGRSIWRKQFTGNSRHFTQLFCHLNLCVTIAFNVGNVFFSILTIEFYDSAKHFNHNNNYYIHHNNRKTNYVGGKVNEFSIQRDVIAINAVKRYTQWKI